MLSGFTQVATLEVEAHQCPFGWMTYSVLQETATCLNVVIMAGETTTVIILKMPVLPALEQLGQVWNEKELAIKV